MGEVAPGAAHALRARAGMARAGLGREAGCESRQGAQRAAQGTPRSGAQAVAWTALVTFPKRKVTRAAAAARNRASLRGRVQEHSPMRDASTTARSFAMLRMTTRGGNGMEHNYLPRNAHKPRSRGMRANGQATGT